MGKPNAFRKLKAAKKFHPKSRKAKKFASAILREERLGQKHADRSLKLKSITKKLSWFRSELEGFSECSPKLVLELIDRYFHRFDAEMEQIEIENTIVKERKGRAHASREASIRITLDNEKRDFETSGFELPNLLSKTVFENLLEWDGITMKRLPSFKMVVMKRCSLESLANKDNCSTEELEHDFEELENDTEEFEDDDMEDTEEDGKTSHDDMTT